MPSDAGVALWLQDLASLQQERGEQ
jgi:hypothetical protein